MRFFQKNPAKLEKICRDFVQQNFAAQKRNFFAKTIITIDYQLPIAIIFVQISWLI